MTTSRKTKHPLTGLRNYPDDFEELFTLINSTEEILIIEKKIQKNKFFKWLNLKKEPCHFWNAKQRMIKAGLLPSVDVISSSTSKKKYQLEYICILCVHYFIFNEPILTQVPALTPDIRKIYTAISDIKEEAETKGIMPFKNNIVYQVLLKSIDILLKDGKDGEEKSIYSMAKIYPELGREIMFRWFVRALFFEYLQPGYNKIIKNEFIKNIALDLTEQFFEPRISTVPLDTIPKIRSEVTASIKLCSMTIGEFLGLPSL